MNTLKKRTPSEETRWALYLELSQKCSVCGKPRDENRKGSILMVTPANRMLRACWTRTIAYMKTLRPMCQDCFAPYREADSEAKQLEQTSYESSDGAENIYHWLSDCMRKMCAEYKRVTKHEVTPDDLLRIHKGWEELKKTIGV